MFEKRVVSAMQCAISRCPRAVITSVFRQDVTVRTSSWLHSKTGAPRAALHTPQQFTDYFCYCCASFLERVVCFNL